MGTSVVAVAAKRCKPFILEVMVMIPESGYKFEVVVEKSCTPEKEALWKLVFDLYQKIDTAWEQIVHISFKPLEESEKKGIQSMVVDGVTAGAAEVLNKEVFPVAKEVASGEATEAQKASLHAGMSKAAVKQLDV